VVGLSSWIRVQCRTLAGEESKRVSTPRRSTTRSSSKYYSGVTVYILCDVHLVGLLIDAREVLERLLAIIGFRLFSL
jgi:hypothetical protein